LYRYTDYIKTMLKKMVAFSLIIAVILVVLGYTGYVWGWLVGSSLNVIYLLMLFSRTVRAMNLPPAKAVAFIQMGAVLRLFTIILVLIIILQFPIIHFGAAVAGILSFKVVIYLDTLIRSLRGKEEGR
jgi:hypothetical protein